MIITMHILEFQYERRKYMEVIVDYNNDENYGAVVEYHDSVKSVISDYSNIKIYKYDSEVVIYQRDKVLNFSIVG